MKIAKAPMMTALEPVGRKFIPVWTSGDDVLVQWQVACNDSSAFHHLQTSAFSAADNLDCFSSAHKHHPSIQELLLDGVAATIAYTHVSGIEPLACGGTRWRLLPVKCHHNK